MSALIAAGSAVEVAIVPARSYQNQRIGRNCVGPLPRLPCRNVSNSSNASFKKLPTLKVRSASADASVSTSEASANWIPVIPIEALPKGERRLVRQSGETILLLWYRNEIFAIENVSPAEGAYSEGFINAKLTQEGSIVCPITDSTYDLRTGAVKEWYPNNPVLRFLTPSLRDMKVYPVKVDNYQICVNISNYNEDAAEVVFGGDIKVGRTAVDVPVEEVRMVVDENEGGFGFTTKNELINGRAAMAGFFMLLIIELVTGKGLLSVTGFLDFLYRTVLPGYPVL